LATWNNSNGRAGDRGRGPGGQAEMGEDLGDHGGIFDGGDDLQGAAAVGVVLNIDIEHPFEQPGPADVRRRRGVGCVGVNLCGVSCVDRGLGTIAERCLPCILGAPSRPLPGPGSGREHAMEAD